MSYNIRERKRIRREGEEEKERKKERREGREDI